MRYDHALEVPASTAAQLSSLPSLVNTQTLPRCLGIARFLPQTGTLLGQCASALIRLVSAFSQKGRNNVQTATRLK